MDGAKVKSDAFVGYIGVQWQWYYKLCPT